MGNEMSHRRIPLVDIFKGFAMIMVVEVSELSVPFARLVEELRELGEANALDIRTMHEDVFNSMHRI